MKILSDGSLFLTDLDKSDSGIYSCYKANSAIIDERVQIKVFVKSKFID